MGADAIDSRDATTDRVNCGNQADDTATVDDIDDLAACPDEGAGLTVVDTTPPETTLSDVTITKRTRSATLTFSGSDARSAVVFECKLDEGAFAPCQSPHTYDRLKHGSYTVWVRAKDAAGNIDRTPEQQQFRL